MAVESWCYTSLSLMLRMRLIKFNNRTPRVAFLPLPGELQTFLVQPLALIDVRAALRVFYSSERAKWRVARVPSADGRHKLQLHSL